MATYKVGINTTNKRDVYVCVGDDSLPGGTTALPNFVHDSGSDVISAEAESHALYHHIRDTLYTTKFSDLSSGAMHPDGIYDMQNIEIHESGNNLLTKSLEATPPAIEVEEAATQTFVVKMLPQDENIVAAKWSFTVDDTDIATYSAPGGVHTITGGAEGTTFITIASNQGGPASTVIPITVTAP
jgi:hypothetical protein